MGGDKSNEYSMLLIHKHGSFCAVLQAQWSETYIKVKSCTGVVVISLHCKHDMFAYIMNVTNIQPYIAFLASFIVKATAPY